MSVSRGLSAASRARPLDDLGLVRTARTRQGACTATHHLAAASRLRPPAAAEPAATTPLRLAYDSLRVLQCRTVACVLKEAPLRVLPEGRVGVTLLQMLG